MKYFAPFNNANNLSIFGRGISEIVPFLLVFLLVVRSLTSYSLYTSGIAVVYLQVCVLFSQLQ